MGVRISTAGEELPVSPPRLRASKEHGGIVAVPAFDCVSALLGENWRSLANTTLTVLGKPLPDLRRLARREILDASARYHLEHGEDPPRVSSDEVGFWFVAGHQPELFHPGVWYKNFVLHELAKIHQTVSVNLIIDTDATKPTLLHVPAGEHIARVPFDRSTAETPYEERVVEDEATYADVPKRVAALASGWHWTPMVESFWNEAMRQAGRTRFLGERIAGARRAIERRWGMVQRELPMSRVCDGDAFAYFVCAILAELPRFRTEYNRALLAYRHENGIRSRSHPVPELATVDGWLEAPFWAWRVGQSRRAKLFVRRRGDQYELSAGGDVWPSVSIDDPIAMWSSLRRDGFKIRSRALTTTMFARLFLADIFIHGIGGGLYDALTDRIMERFFAIPAPSFLVVSATMLLPLQRHPDAAPQAQSLARRKRDLIYKPELFANRVAQSASLLQKKQGWIHGDCSTHSARARRFTEIRAINAQLAPLVRADRDACERELVECRRRQALDEVARRRDYAFCLYPEEMLQNFFMNPIR